MSHASPAVVTRFAPSPSGHLHIGGARTALFCWAFARRHGGHFLIRLEDTDQARSSETSARAILEDLAWLGIDWDEGPELQYQGRRIGGDPRHVAPFRQSDRLDHYNAAIEQLIASGSAYPAFESTEELDLKRKAALAEKKTYRYDRAALQIPEAERIGRVRAGEPHVVRLRAPDHPIVVHDQVLGDVTFAAGELEDFVIRKRDGFPTYHMAVVVDDELMGVTHVLRGQEHLINTPKHIALQQALGYRAPVYAHMPLIFNEQGAKMSKRERDQAARQAVKQSGLTATPIPDAIRQDDFQAWLADKNRQLDPEQLEALSHKLDFLLPEVSVEDFRAAGYLPEVINNFIALLGWTPSRADDGSEREKFDMAFLARDFDLARMGKTNARFDRRKLLAFNGDAIAALPADDFAARWRAWCTAYRPDILRRLSDEAFNMLAAANQRRCKTLADAGAEARFALISADEIEYDDKAVRKFLHKNDGAGFKALEQLRTELSNLSDFDSPTIHEWFNAFAESSGLGMGGVAQPLRIAMTGTSVSPSIDETLAILGRQEVLRRIDRCLNTVPAAG